MRMNTITNDDHFVGRWLSMDVLWHENVNLHIARTGLNRSSNSFTINQMVERAAIIFRSLQICVDCMTNRCYL